MSPSRRMRHAAVLAVVQLLAAVTLYAQTGEKTGIELEHLRTPTSPAFTLLGVNPSAIARPSTPRALATELVSSTKRGSVIPNSYAAEFAPYWLVPRPAITFKDYKDKGQTLLQSLSVSLATARPDTGADSLNTMLAVGLRALPVGGRVSRKFLVLDSLMTVQQKANNRLVGRYLKAQKSQTVELARIELLVRDSIAVAAAGRRVDSLGGAIQQGGLRLDSATTTVDTLQRLMARIEDSLAVLSKAMGAEERMGHFIEVATAVSVAYRDGTFDSGRFNKLAVWGTYTYRVESKDTDVITLLRYVRGLAFGGEDAIELGGRLHWSREALGLSSEFLNRAVIGRFATTTGPGGGVRTFSLTSSSRVVAIVDYRAADEMYVTMSFGKDYRQPGETHSPLVARLGVQLSAGKKPVVLPSGGS